MARITRDPRTMSLRQWMALLDPPLYTPKDLVRVSGVPQPRCSECLRGMTVYPAAEKKIRKALKINDDALWLALVANSRAAEESRRAAG